MLLQEYIFIFLKATIPFSNHAYYEKEEVTQARYQSIATTIAVVAQESPIFDNDPLGVKTALLLGSTAAFEGSLREDVDSCKKGGDKDKFGNYLAWTLWQVHAKKEDVCASREAGAREARERLRFSLKSCKFLPIYDRLSAYTEGSCRENSPTSRARFIKSMNWFDHHAFQ